MENPRYIKSQGRLIILGESLAKLAVVFSDLIKEIEIVVSFVGSRDKEYVDANIFINKVFRSVDDGEYVEIDDIFLHSVLSEYGGFRAFGYMVSFDQTRYPIEILYLSTSEFGVYKVDTEHTYLNPIFN